MRWRRAILGLALAFASGFALAQTGIISTTLTGNEVIVAAVGGPGGPSLFVPVAELRGAVGYAVTTTATGTTPASVTAGNLNTRVIYNAALTGSVTHNTPTAPFDGQMLEIVNGTGANFTQTITLTASGTQTVNSGAVVNLSANSSAEWQFVAGSTNTWFRIR